MPTSGTTLFNPSLGDLTIEAFARCLIDPGQIEAKHMFHARMSANLLLAEWGVKGGPNLWKVTLQSINLTQGVSTYAIPANTVAILDYYVRQFQFGAGANLTPALSTSTGGGFILAESGLQILSEAGSPVLSESGGATSQFVTVTFPNHGLVPGAFVNFLVPVSIGGIIVLGFYQVQTVANINTFTIQATQTPTLSQSGGVVPGFTPNGSTTLTVFFPNHGLSLGGVFTVQVPLLVGGVPVSGPYTVATVIDTNTFTIVLPNAAVGGPQVFENGGLMQIQRQLTNADPQDRVILPISRTEYSSQPDKFTQTIPTSVWFDRTINPTVTLWPVPDGNGPYVLFYYAMQQIQDAVMPGGVGLDVPNRFLPAFAAGLAYKLARKFPTNLVKAGIAVGELKVDYDEAWTLAAQQDVEDVPLYVIPGLTGYMRQ